MYRDDFVCISCAFAWHREDGSIKSVVKRGESDIEAFLKRLAESNVPLICFNHQFEYGVTKARFPGLESLWTVDAMRLVQMTDNGGPEYEDKQRDSWDEDAWLDDLMGTEKKSGLSLDAAITRFLPPDCQGHKQRALDLIVSRGGRKGDFHLLTEDELSAYNADDAINTLKLYQTLTEILAGRGINWNVDHELYLSTSRLCADAKCRGIKIDFKALNSHIDAKKKALEQISTAFISAHQEAIKQVESRLLDRALSKVKTRAAKDRLRANPPRFNTRSTDQLAMLFVDVLGIQPKFRTEKGKPSFSKKLLGQWGAGGLMLAKQRTELIELKQGESLLDLGEYDGRWHQDIKTAGTRTGRLSGGEQA
jgi:hypothetical protein